LRIDEIVDIVKTIMENDATISSEYSDTVITHKYDDSPDDEIIVDNSYATIRFMSEVTMEQIGTYVDRDANDDPVTGIFRDCLISVYCWNETESGATKLADYTKNAIFRARFDYEDEGVIDMCEFNAGEGMTTRGPYGSYRAILYFRMCVKQTIT